jgi:hypothetical protein
MKPRLDPPPAVRVLCTERIEHITPDDSHERDCSFALEGSMLFPDWEQG